MKLLVLAFSFALLGCEGQSTATEADAPARVEVQAIPVRVAAATSTKLVRSLELGGVATAGRAARLAPSGQGVVTSLPVKLGQKVKKGQLLAALDVSTMSLQLDQARKSADLARLQLQDAESSATRIGVLSAEGAVSTVQLDQASMAKQLAEAQVAQAVASLAVLENQISKARLIAPFGGMITGVFLEEGEFFTGMAGMGGPPALVAVESIDPLHLDVHVPDVDLARVSPGMRAVVSGDAFPGRSWDGVVELIGASADRGARTFTVRVSVPNPDDALRPGLFLDARLILEEQADVLAIPDVAVADPDSEKPYVMVASADKAKRVYIQVGLKGDEGWAVEGLNAGDEVIIEGQFGLPDGATIRVID
jgi:RND family efflux transporter MFP subunit